MPSFAATAFIPSSVFIFEISVPLAIGCKVFLSLTGIFLF